jgi:uncharacterized protein (DUF1800 family)
MKMQRLLLSLAFTALLSVAGGVRAQSLETQPERGMAVQPDSMTSAAQPSMSKSGVEDDAVPATAAQQKASKTFAFHTAAAKAAQVKKMAQGKVLPPAVAKAVVLTPLSPRERVVQLLNRFTFGPQPGEVDRVLAQGEDTWLAAQLNPDKIPDGALGKRLGDYPTLAMTPDQVLKVFPDRQQAVAVEQGKMPYPGDPLLNNVYEVQIYKLHQEEAERKAQAAAVAAHTNPPEKTDAEKAAQRKLDQAEASRIAGELYAVPKDKRMAALIAMPVEERAVFTADGDLVGEQRNQLLADLTPREREAFQAMSGPRGASYKGIDELAQGRVLRDILSERQLQAVMSDFWFNHFNVYFPKDSDQWYTATYERDTIRRNALTSFPQLLLATAQSPAMMVYLDNWLSIGPDSIANGVDPTNPNAKRGNKGLNENYGREVMELHTVGVNGGYTQADVTALAAILTGWGVDRVQQGGGFQFDYKRHEPGPKVWLGYVIEDDGKVTKLGPEVQAPARTFGASNTVATPDSVKQGMAALNILAMSPQTAHFISYLLAQYFVADEPPAALVNRLQATYLGCHGDIKTMLRAIIASPEFNSRQYYRNKVKTPEEFVASAFRATATDPQNPGALVGTINNMGMPLYRALPPTGYYLTADQWMSSSALVNRLNFAYQLTNSKFANQKFDAPKLLATGLLTPSIAGDLSAYRAEKAVALPSAAAASPAQAKRMGMIADAPAATVVMTPGAQMAMRVLEATMIGGPVSAQTNQLIDKQMERLPGSPTDTLNLLTALMMGSPEFQVR